MTNDYHKNRTSVVYRIADANWGMYHTDSFKTEGEAREAIDTHYTNRNKGDGSDEYWRNRPQVVLRETVITEVL